MTWWYWLSMGLVLMALEMVAPSGFYLMFFGLSALAVGALTGVADVEPEWLQWVLFSGLAVVSLLLFRGPLLARLKTIERKGAPVDTMVGDTGVFLAEKVEHRPPVRRNEPVDGDDEPGMVRILVLVGTLGVVCGAAAVVYAAAFRSARQRTAVSAVTGLAVLAGVFQLVPIVACKPLSANFRALLGRDLLAHCLFVYDGPANRFSLAF